MIDIASHIRGPIAVFTTSVLSILSACAPFAEAPLDRQAAISANAPAAASDAAVFADLHEDMIRYVERHRDRARKGYYPDGSTMGPVCLVVTVEACLAEEFLRAQGLVEELDPTILEDNSHLILDVRGETERASAPLPAALPHRVVTYGFDRHDPLAMTELDRAAFADAVTEIRADDPRPLALLCTMGMRSRAAVAALRENGIHDAASIRGGIRQAPSLSPSSS